MGCTQANKKERVKDKFITSPCKQIQSNSQKNIDQPKTDAENAACNKGNNSQPNLLNSRNSIQIGQQINFQAKPTFNSSVQSIINKSNSNNLSIDNDQPMHQNYESQQHSSYLAQSSVIEKDVHQQYNFPTKNQDNKVQACDVDALQENYNHINCQIKDSQIPPKFLNVDVSSIKLQKGNNSETQIYPKLSNITLTKSGDSTVMNNDLQNKNEENQKKSTQVYEQLKRQFNPNDSMQNEQFEITDGKTFTHKRECPGDTIWTSEALKTNFELVTISFIIKSFGAIGLITSSYKERIEKYANQKEDKDNEKEQTNNDSDERGSVWLRFYKSKTQFWNCDGVSKSFNLENKKIVRPKEAATAIILMKLNLLENKITWKVGDQKELAPYCQPDFKLSEIQIYPAATCYRPGFSVTIGTIQYQNLLV